MFHKNIKEFENVKRIKEEKCAISKYFWKRFQTYFCLGRSEQHKPLNAVDDFS